MHKIERCNGSCIFPCSRHALTHQAGCLAGTMQTFITTPAELIKIRMQAPGSAFTGSAQCLVASLRAAGLRRGLFKGFWITFLRDCPNIGIYFLSYEGCKQLLRPGQAGGWGVGANAAVLLAGGIAGMVGVCCFIIIFFM